MSCSVVSCRVVVVSCMHRVVSDWCSVLSAWAMLSSSSLCVDVATGAPLLNAPSNKNTHAATDWLVSDCVRRNAFPIALTDRRIADMATSNQAQSCRDHTVCAGGKPPRPSRTDPLSDGRRQWISTKSVLFQCGCLCLFVYSLAGTLPSLCQEIGRDPESSQLQIRRKFYQMVERRNLLAHQ